MPRRTADPKNDTPVAELWNLSTLTASWLNDVDIYTYRDLEESDLIDVWLRLKDRHHQVTKLMYYALWGAVNNCHWQRIPEDEKKKLDEI